MILTISITKEVDSEEQAQILYDKLCQKLEEFGHTQVSGEIHTPMEKPKS